MLYPVREGWTRSPTSVLHYSIKRKVASLVWSECGTTRVQCPVESTSGSTTWSIPLIGRSEVKERGNTRQPYMAEVLLWAPRVLAYLGLMLTLDIILQTIFSLNLYTFTDAFCAVAFTLSPTRFTNITVSRVALNFPSSSQRLWYFVLVRLHGIGSCPRRR